MKYKKSDAKAAAQAHFHGIWAAVTTPFTADFGLDETGLRRNMRHLTDTLAIDGVFCTGVMGEFWTLTKEERKRVVEIVVEEVRGKCGVIAQTGSHSAHETIELTRHAEDVGADFAIMMGPYYPHTDEAMILDWFGFVAARVDLGIWLFDTPFSGRPALSPETTSRIAEIDNICGAKISRPLDHYLAVRKLCGERIVMSSPSEGDFLMMMREHGQRVHQSSASPYLIQTAERQEMRQYADLALAGRFDDAAEVSARLDPLREISHRWIMGRWRDTGVIPIAAIKEWSAMLGMAAGPVRTPLLQMAEGERAAMRRDLEATGILADQPMVAAIV
jgi:4-hydroxy-tetrahydrodipicolinate synthase